MCKLLEDMVNEAVREATREAEQKAKLKNARETAERMIKKGKLTLEEIIEYVPLVSLEELKEIEMRVMQLT